jgi:transcriptional regulator with XRE-family HTH domain
MLTRDDVSPPRGPPMTFGEKIRKLRREKKLSQAELADKVSMNSNHLSRLERGVGLPSTEILKRLAQTLEVSIDYLLSEDDTDAPAAEVRIENKALAERVKLIEELDSEDQEAVFRVIDSMLTKKKMRRFLESELAATG